jgi:putative membrane protein
MAPNHGRLRVTDWTVIALTLFLAWSGVSPNDRIVWVLEVFWVAIAIVMWAVWLRRLPVTTVTFTIVVVHSVILIVGGIYTYSKVPAGAWVQEWMGRPRNDYDRLGHFIQGFAPALIWREVFIRKAIVAGRGWLSVIVVGMCLAFSALFELLEFASALLLGEDSINFLGAQGDVWDAQWDMLFCMVGAAMAVAMLGPMQDRQIARG